MYIYINQMASKQIIVNEAIAKAVAEMTKAAIQAISLVTIERPQGMTGPRIGGPIMKHTLISKLKISITNSNHSD